MKFNAKMISFSQDVSGSICKNLHYFLLLIVRIFDQISQANIVYWDESRTCIALRRRTHRGISVRYCSLEALYNVISINSVLIEIDDTGHS